jgi:hypothetical protein
VTTTMVVELATFVAGIVALVAMYLGYRRFKRSQPGDPDNLRAQATVWTSAGVLIMTGANALTVLIGPGDVRVLVAGLPLVGVSVWCFVKAFRLRKLAA